MGECGTTGASQVMWGFGTADVGGTSPRARRARSRSCLEAEQLLELLAAGFILTRFRMYFKYWVALEPFCFICLSEVTLVFFPVL